VTDQSISPTSTPHTPTALTRLMDRARAHPDDVSNLHQLGIALAEGQQPKQAVEALRQAATLAPQNAHLQADLAQALARVGDFAACLHHLGQAIAFEPHNVNFLCQLAHVLLTLDQVTDAQAVMTAAVQLAPNHAYAYEVLGLTQYTSLQWQEAAQSFSKAVQLNPTSAAAYNNWALATREMGKLHEAIQLFGEARRLDPRFDDAAFNQGTTHLLQGEFEQGWPLYLAHKREQRLRDRPQFGALWTGTESLDGRTILIYREQGLGDTLQFIRYLRALNERGARVYFAPHTPLVPLLNHTRLPFTVTTLDETRLNTDFHCPLLSLPALLEASQAAPVPYIDPAPDRVAAWKTRLGTHGFKIGLHWQGSVGNVDVGRSMPLSAFAPLASLPNVRLISLQKGPAAAQVETVGFPVESLTGDWDQDAFMDTAAVLANLDVLVCADSAITHLAGAMGVPTWVALKKVPDWRWQLDTPESRWYPTMRLFRQSTDGDWGAVVDSMVAALRHMS